MPLQAISNTIWLGPQMVAAIVVLATAPEPFECDKPLAAYLIVAVLRMALLLSIAWTAFKYRSVPLHGRPKVARILDSLFKPISTFGLVWFLFGNLWVFGSGESKQQETVHRNSYWTSLVATLQLLLLLNNCLVL